MKLFIPKTTCNSSHTFFWIFKYFIDAGDAAGVTDLERELGRDVREVRQIFLRRTIIKKKFCN